MADEHLTLPITGMTCANCVATIERNLKRLPGVENAVEYIADLGGPDSGHDTLETQTFPEFYPGAA